MPLFCALTEVHNATLPVGGAQRTAARHGSTAYGASLHIHLDTGSVERAAHGPRVRLAPFRIPLKVLLPGGVRDRQDLVQQEHFAGRSRWLAAKLVVSAIQPLTRRLLSCRMER